MKSIEEHDLSINKMIKLNKRELVHQLAFGEISCLIGLSPYEILKFQRAEFIQALSQRE